MCVRNMGAGVFTSVLELNPSLSGMRMSLLVLSGTILLAAQSCKKETLDAPITGRWRLVAYAQDRNGDQTYQESEKAPADSNHEAYLRIGDKYFTDSTIIYNYLRSRTYPYQLDGRTVYEVQFGAKEARATVQQVDATRMQLHVPADSVLTWRFYEQY